MKKLIATVLLVVATSANAWGDREQGALAGIAGTLLYQHVTQPRPTYVQPSQAIIVGQQSAPPVVIGPPPAPPMRAYNLPSQYGMIPPGRPVYEERVQWDYACNCYIRVLNQIGWQ